MILLFYDIVAISGGSIVELINQNNSMKPLSVLQNMRKELLCLKIRPIHLIFKISIG